MAKPTSWPSMSDAVAALIEDGYQEGFASPGRPRLFIGKKGDRVAVLHIKTPLRDDETVVEDWERRPYPEPSCATPDQVENLKLIEEIPTS